MPSIKFYLQRWSPYSTWFQTKLLQPFPRKFQFCVWGPTERPLFLDLEYSYSPGIDLCSINTWIPNVNKICPTVQALGKCTYIHTYTHTHTHVRATERRTAFQKLLFSIRGCWKRENPSVFKDRPFHGHSTVPYWVYKEEKNTLSGDHVCPSACLSGTKQNRLSSNSIWETFTENCQSFSILNYTVP
jgi:hypothetical protein